MRLSEFQHPARPLQIEVESGRRPSSVGLKRALGGRVDHERKLATREIEVVNVPSQQLHRPVARKMGTLRTEAVGVARQHSSEDSKVPMVVRPQQVLQQPLSDETGSTGNKQTGSSQGLPVLAAKFKHVI